MTYAVKVPFDDEGMLYVVEGDSKFHLRVQTWETFEQAEEHAKLWGDNAVVVEYEEQDNAERKFI